MSQVNVIFDTIQQKVEAITSRETREKALMAGIEAMDKIKNTETRRGRSPVKNGDWDNSYKPNYAKRNNKSTGGPVTLRNGKGRIEQTTKVISGNDGVLSFRDGKIAKAFNYHQNGTAKSRRGKANQIYPTSFKNLPKKVFDAVVDAINKEIKK